MTAEHDGTATPRADTSSAGRTALLTTVDQTLASVSNALLLFVLAQSTTVGQFGVAALMVAIVMAWMGFNRGALSTPILLVSNLSRDDVKIEAGYALTWSALTGAAAFGTLVVVGAATGELAMAVTFGLATPVLLVQDVWRFVPIACGRPAVAVLSDGCWALAMTVLFVTEATQLTSLSVEWTILGWALSGVLSITVLVTLFPVRPHTYRLLSWWRTYAPARIRFGATYASIALSTAGVIAVIAWLAGPAAAGAIRGASTVFGPVMMVMTALPTIFVPHALKSTISPRAKWRQLTMVAAATSVLTVVGTAVLMALPVELGNALLGATWEPALSAVPFIGLESAGVCWIVAVYSWLQARGNSSTLLWIRVLHIGCQVTACATVALLMASVQALAFALAAACWITVAAGILAVRRDVAGMGWHTDQFTSVRP